MSNLCPHISSGASVTPVHSTCSPIYLFFKDWPDILQFIMILEQSTAKLFQKHTEAQFVPQALQSFFDSVYWTRLGKWSEIFQSHIYSEQERGRRRQECGRFLSTLLNQYGDGLAWCYGHSSYWISDFSAQCLQDLLPVISTPAPLAWKSHRAPYLPAVLHVRSKKNPWSALERFCFW